MSTVCEAVSEGKRTIQRTEEDRAPEASEDPYEVSARNLGRAWILWLCFVGVYGAVGFGVWTAIAEERARLVGVAMGRRHGEGSSGRGEGDVESVGIITPP